MKIKKVGKIERHPLVEKGKQINIKILRNNVENVISFAQNTLNNEWMCWDYWNNGMWTFKTFRQVNAFIKDIKINNDVLDDFIL